MSQPVRLSAAVDQYLAARAVRYAGPTVKNEGHVLTRFVANLGDPRVDQVTPDRVEQWFADIMAPHTDRMGVDRPPVAASTANFYRTRVKSFSAYCVARGWTRSDWLAHSPRMRETKRVRQQPKPTVLFAMLDATPDPRDRALLAVAMQTGLRAAEIARLRVGDLDLAEGNLSVYVSKSRLEDTMPVTSDLDEEMRRWLPAYAASIGRPLIAEDYLLPAHTGPRIRWRKGPDGLAERYVSDSILNPTQPVSKLHRTVQQAMRSVGLETRGEGVHTLRRAVARAYFDSLRGQGHEFAIRQTSALLHHSNASTTEAYLGLTAEREARDLSMRGKSFMARPTKDNVIPLRSVR